MKKELDDRNLEIRMRNILLWDQREGPRVGDFIKMDDETLRRFTHDWNDDGLQVTSGGGDGSFYFGGGYMSYSGGLDPIVPIAHIQEISEQKDGACWFFDHGLSGAGRGVETVVPCRMFREVTV